MRLAISKEYKRDLRKIVPEILSSAEFAEVLHCLPNIATTL